MVGHLSVPDLPPLLETLAGEAVVGEVGGQSVLQDGLHHAPHRARALVSLHTPGISRDCGDLQ